MVKYRKQNLLHRGEVQEGKKFQQERESRKLNLRGEREEG